MGASAPPSSLPSSAQTTQAQKKQKQQPAPQQQAPPQQQAQPQVVVPVQGALEPLCAATRAAVLRPHSFFVSWQGVLTLALKGWVPALRQLKDSINSTITSLPPENPGALWPKVTLGALNDAVRLTPEQLQVLNRICREASGAFQTPCSPKSQAILVDQLEVVFYSSRSLERRVAAHSIPLSSQGQPDWTEPSPEESSRVQAIVEEAESPQYWFRASKDGNRNLHYRGPALGASLVHYLSAFRQCATSPYGSALPAIIAKLRRQIDAELPGLYCWFDDASLHVTVRGLMG